jgi:undecaprenyl-diphosphatase
MDLVQATILALIQGITEFLPISSSGHLVLPSQVLGWPDQGLAFDTAVHLGSLVAVATFFWRDLVRYIRAGYQQLLLQRPSDDGQYAVCLLIASLPTLPVGFLGRYFIEENFRSIEVIAATTIIFGLALWYADRIRQAKPRIMTARNALLIGFAQCLALIPGTSRSGITITAALMLGFSRSESARFSFLMAIPTILGAAGLKLMDLVTDFGEPDWAALALGTAVAAASAYACISLLMRWVDQIGFLPFVIYRLILGVILIGLVL